MRETMSTATESLTQKWLQQAVQSYAFKEAVYTHVDTALSRFNAIRPKTDVYTYDDGRTQLLLCLHGLLPIAYRGASYNIPIAVWITRDYPREPPITYVVPTTDMLVRSSIYIDVSGRCMIAYLQNWEKKSEGCNLAALLEAMQEHFSREPPVYAKPRTTKSPQPQPQTQLQRPATVAPAYASRPPPPVPSTATSPPPLSHAAPGPPLRNDHRPLIPLKPGQQSTLTMPPAASTPADVNHRSASVHGSSSTVMRPPPPLPPHPPSDPGLPQYRTSSLPPYNATHDRSFPTGAAAPASVSTSGVQTPATWVGNETIRTASTDASNYRASIPPYSPPPSTELPLMASPARPPPPVPHGHPHHPPPPPPPIPTSPPIISQPLSSPPPPPPVNLAQSVSPQATGATYGQHGHAVHPWPASQTHPPSTYPPAPAPPPVPRPPPPAPAPNLLDAPDDLAPPSVLSPAPVPAPPRPPNPELLRLHDAVHAKLASELASLVQATALDGERLRAHQTDLLAGEPAIRDEMARLEAVRDVCRGVAARMRGVVDEAERNVAELRRRGDPSVDELVCSTTIVHDQLINLVAEDNAIEDTIYHLHRALNAGRIDLERFLRTTRILAEEQFTKRALIEKILGGIPMTMGESSPHMRSEWY